MGADSFARVLGFLSGVELEEVPPEKALEAERAVEAIEQILPPDDDVALMAIYRALYKRLHHKTPAEPALEAYYVLKAYSLALQSLGFDPTDAEEALIEADQLAEELARCLLSHRLNASLLALWDVLQSLARSAVQLYEATRDATLN